MFIIIEQSDTEFLQIVSHFSMGKTMFFDTYAEAQEFAIENLQTWKVVEL